ncbi:CapA family protein [Pontibacter chinhatensis]|nr:CapA family protein [Pontibacter chinhatensis]
MGDDTSLLTLFLCGDVMTGRGLDQVLPVSVDPQLYEAYVQDARDYVRLAERKNGEISKPVAYTYPWGDALEVWDRVKPQARIINLETSITTHPQPWPGKQVQYRMHPNNVKLLNAASINIATLANNHTLDWGRPGLAETLQVLHQAGISTAGAGQNLKEAQQPAVLPLPQGRLIVLAYGSPSSGVYPEWAAGPSQSGINFLPDLSQGTLQSITTYLKNVKKPGDVVIFSVHWGGNWGYDIPAAHRAFAHRLIEEAGVDAVFGHSSHHPMGLEVYRGKMIMYGAGGFINDYEGIAGHEPFRSDLSLMYFPVLEPATGRLVSLRMVPLQIRMFRLHYASEEDNAWLAQVLHRESMKFGTAVKRQGKYLVLEF